MALHTKLDSLLNEPEDESKDFSQFILTAVLEGPKDVSVIETSVSGPYGEIPIRIYQGSKTAEKKCPCFIFLHAGGWCYGGFEQTDSFCRYLAQAAPLKVISVDYKLAPEFQFPTQTEEILRVIEWLKSDNPLDIDINAIGIGGRSAGANIAISTLLQLFKDTGDSLQYLLLDSPAVDHTMQSSSYQDYAEGFALTKSDMRDAWGNYLPSSISESEICIASPIDSLMLDVLPKTRLYAMEYDPLRDEALLFCESLIQAGVDAEISLVSGFIHGASSLTKLLPEAKVLQDEMIGDIVASLKTESGE